MSISSQNPFVIHTANGVTTTFTYPFKAFLTGDIDVYLNGVIQSSGYTITMRDTDGDVVFSSAPANGVEVAILRDVGTARNEVYTERGPFLGTTVNRDLDRRQALMQEVLARSIQQSPIEAARSGGALKLPPYDYGSFLGWGVGNQLENISPSVYASGVGREVNSLADLRLITGNPADTYRTTKGYYTSGDGGSNSFYWDGTSSDVDNGGTVIKPTAVSGAGRWLAIDTSYITPAIFGAKGDGITNDYLALQRALNLGKPIYLSPSKVYATETGLVTVSPYQRIVGASTGFSTDSTRGSWIKYTGTTNTGALVLCAAPNHGFVLEDVTLDCNDKIYYGLWLKSLAGQSLQMPSLNRCNYRGYLRAGLLMGSSSETVLENGALQMCTITHQSFWGGGASAPDTTKVYGILINAQNCEFATMIGMYFDPFTSVGGGPYINHYNHIKGVSGGLNISGMVTTRATGYAIQIVSDSSLIVNGWRCEDIYVVNYPVTAGFPSNPILIENLDHRAGLADGTGDAIVLKYSGNQLATVRNCRVTGNIAIGGTVAKSATIKDIIYRAGDVSPFAVGSTTITAPVVAIADLEPTAGQRTLYNPNAVETWYNGATPIFKNNKGSLSYLDGISGSNVQCNNFGGALYFLTTTSVASVTFSTAESDANYRVQMTVNDVTGAAAAGSNRVKSISKTTAGFTVTLEAAPGAGCDTTFSWMIFR